MSYSRRYSGNVYYQDSVTVYCEGNTITKNVSGYVPVEIEIDVDTTPFDRSVHDCKNHINALTGSVAATEAAQVASTIEASQKISKSIIKGFFDYVGSGLSQKIKELMSKVEALMVSLMGHKEACDKKTSQMHDDYERISRRYAKIFTDLDNETKSRINLLDKPAFQFVDETMSVLARSVNNEVLGLSTISADENTQLSTLISCSLVKHQASDVISQAKEFLKGTYRLNADLRDMLDSEPADDREYYLPYLFVESNSSSGKTIKMFGADERYVPADSKVRADFLDETAKWDRMPDGEFTKIVSYLNNYVQQDNLDERTADTLISLIGENSIQTL